MLIENTQEIKCFPVATTLTQTAGEQASLLRCHNCWKGLAVVAMQPKLTAADDFG